MTTLPIMHPDRPVLRMRPFKALKHFRNLVANKESTEEVFHIFQSLPSRNFLGEVEAFVTSDAGKALMASEPDLPPLLDDHARLRQMPRGSVAHAYCDFMEREGLTAAGLVAEYDQFQPRRFADLMEWYIARNRDTHDMLHILTGYGRDSLGEACVLAFTYGQNPAPGHLFIAYLAGWEIMKQSRGSGAKIFAAINQARRHGRGAPRVAEQPIEELLVRDLDDVRRAWHIGAPTAYTAAHDAMRAVGMDPYNMLKAPEGAGELAAI